MGGGMETNKNRWIEDWATSRENLEHHFRWTRRNLALVGIFGVAVPVLVYKGIIKEFVRFSSFPPIQFYDDVVRCFDFPSSYLLFSALAECSMLLPLFVPVLFLLPPLKREMRAIAGFVLSFDGC